MYNNSRNSTSESWPFWLSHGYTVYLFSVTVLSLLGNSFTIWTFSRRMLKISKIIKWNIISLATSEIIFAVTFLVPSAIKNITVVWTLGDVACKTHMFVRLTVFNISLYLHMFISIQRYTCTIDISKNTITKRTARIAIAGIWILNLMTSTPMLIWTEVRDTRFGLDCVPSLENVGKFKYYVSLSRVINGCIPLIVISVCYTVLGYRYKMNLKKIQPYYRQMEWRQNKMKLTKLCLIIVMLFLTFSLPFQIIYVLYMFLEESVTLNLIALITFCFSILWSTLNPVIYGIMWKSYRTEFVKNCEAIFSCLKLKSTRTDG